MEDGDLKNFIEDTKDLNSTERGHKLVAAAAISDTHKDFAVEGQTGVRFDFYRITKIVDEFKIYSLLFISLQVPTEDEKIIHHFVAFVERDGSIYELGKLLKLIQSIQNIK